MEQKRTKVTNFKLQKAAWFYKDLSIELHLIKLMRTELCKFQLSAISKQKVINGILCFTFRSLS